MEENKSKIQKENEDRVAEEYLSSLADLNCNSKPLINMLTMLAEENIEYAPVIVRVVEQHIHKVKEIKLQIDKSDIDLSLDVSFRINLNKYLKYQKSPGLT